MPEGVIANLERIELLSRRHPVNVLVTGRQGCGKSTLVKQFAGQNKRPLATFQSLDWNICLLIDASGSMRGPKWRMVESIVGTMHQAFRGFRNRLQVYAYFEVGGICMISKLINGKNILSVPPSGQTTSGQALIATASFMPRDERKRFLIHITDGESNFGCNVKCGIDYCRAQDIHLTTLGVAYKDRKAMEKQYGRAIQFLDHFGQLPAALEMLLRWTLLYEGKRVPALPKKGGICIINKPADNINRKIGRSANGDVHRRMV